MKGPDLHAGSLETQDLRTGSRENHKVENKRNYGQDSMKAHGSKDTPFHQRLIPLPASGFNFMPAIPFSCVHCEVLS